MIDYAQRRMFRSASGDGRAARRGGRPRSHCPHEDGSDLANAWKMGWGWEDRDLKGRPGFPEPSEETKALEAWEKATGLKSGYLP